MQTKNISEKYKQILYRYWEKSRLINNESILQAFKSVNRELFVEQSYQKLAYTDQPLPIGSGQTISQPTTVALMLQLLNVLPKHRILEVGTGSGYNAALLAKLGKFVVTVERHKDLVKLARKNLLSVGLAKVKVIEGDGKLGYSNLAPFDRIIITAAAEIVPKNLKDQLTVGGLIVAPIGPKYGCEMKKIVKVSLKSFQVTSHGLFSFVPLI